MEYGSNIPGFLPEKFYLASIFIPYMNTFISKERFKNHQVTLSILILCLKQIVT